MLVEEGNNECKYINICMHELIVGDGLCMVISDVAVGICSYEIITGWDIYIGGVLFYTFLQCVSVIQSWSILTSIYN